MSIKIKQFLNLPLQLFNTAREKRVYVISSSLFFLFFLLIYQPFGFSLIVKEDEHDHTQVEVITTLILIIGVVFLVLSISQFLLRKYFPPKNHNIKYFLNWFFIDISIIVVTITIIKIVFFHEDIITTQNVIREVILKMIVFFFVLSFVLLYPVMGNLVYNYLKQLHNDKKELESDLTMITNHYKMVSGKDTLVKIFDEKRLCKLTIPVSSIYAIESQNQYISIKYLKNNKIIEQSVRTRLSKVLDDLGQFPSIVKCHRSYAVNLVNIERLKYINQKANLIFGVEKTYKIPVSKTYLKEIKSRLLQY